MTTRSHTTLRSKTRLALFPLLLTAACAGYEITPVALTDLKDWGASAKDGYIIYEPDPYLRIVQATVDGKLTASADIIYLPNRNRPYRVSTYAFLATADIKLTYHEGWQLTNAESNVDTASVAKAVIEAVGGAVSMLQDTEPKESSHTVRLFRLEFGTDGHVSKVVQVVAPELEMKVAAPKAPGK